MLVPGALLYARALLAEASGGTEAARAPLTPRERSLLETCATTLLAAAAAMRCFSQNLSPAVPSTYRQSKSAGPIAVMAPNICSQVTVPRN